MVLFLFNGKKTKLVKIQINYAHSLPKILCEINPRSTVNFSTRTVILHFSWRKMLVMPQNRTAFHFSWEKL